MVMNTKIGVYVVLRLSYLLMFINLYRYIPEGKGSRNQNVRTEHTTILLLKRTGREYKYKYAFNNVCTCKWCTSRSRVCHL